MVPEGSYSSSPNGSYRIHEFRKLVAGLNSIGLRVIKDVVFNHTHDSGQNPRSVLDKIVPGYYYRLDQQGRIQHSSCCPDTATEHLMMEKLMIDAIIYWAKTFKLDGFRFDLMGHHTTANLQKIREALDQLTIEKDGVEGSKIYLYGEGWRFGSLNDILPEQACHQANLRGTGIGSFNDRLRDSARGGNYDHSTKSDQGFINGLYYDYNHSPYNRDSSDNPDEQKEKLLNYTDNIRLGLAGNLADYPILLPDGKEIIGRELEYRGQKGAGYTEIPHENVNYISAHDNYTLWDQISAKAPFRTTGRIPETATAGEKMRMQLLGLSLVIFGQGVPFIHAGAEMLRSKSGDGDSYNSSDWFNRLDFTYSDNNWGVGLPPAEKNQADWNFWKPRLTEKEMKPDPELIKLSVEVFCEFLRIRQSSRLFRLRTKENVLRRVRFLDSEKKAEKIPSLIVKEISDDFKDRSLDTEYKRIIVFFNADKEIARFFHPSFVGTRLILHPIQAKSTDQIIKQAFFNAERATVEIPPRSTAVFVEPRFINEK
jgi:pullulanase